MDAGRPRRAPSLRARVLLLLAAIGLPTALLVAVQSVYAMAMARRSSGDAYGRMLSMYQDDIDEGLEAADSYLRRLSTSSRELASLEAAEREGDYYLAKVGLVRELSSDIQGLGAVDAFFAYSPRRDDFAVVFKANESYDERAGMASFLRASLRAFDDDMSAGGLWRVERIGASYFLVRAFRRGELFCGAWTKADNLVAPLGNLGLGDAGIVLLSTGAGHPLTDEAEAARLGLLAEAGDEADAGAAPGAKAAATPTAGFSAFTTRSWKSDASLRAFVPDSLILRGLPAFQWAAALVAASILCAAPLLLRALSRDVFAPLDSMVVAIARVRGGDLAARLRDDEGPGEFRILATAFNDMVSEIRSLTIAVYEQRLDRQREETLRLRAQMNPHFFLNTLNTLRGLMRSADAETADEALMHLVDYFRYVVRNDEELVPLADEMEHARSYHRVQELRFPGLRRLTADIPDYLGEALVPPLSVLTFVENACKHASLPGTPLGIRVTADLKSLPDGSDALALCVSDTGPGFAPGGADLGLDASESAPRDGRMGIRNVARRLSLLYGDRASLSLGGDEGAGGAAVRLVLPFETVRARRPGGEP